ncbi:hypothetical protein [Streptacidiphilus sp. EB103A]|uniref:hypothetical protein n=1 Tax=Streptacidiphilus sp. EB103A TaxID=3156275 RepID=UPI0035118CC1
MSIPSPRTVRSPARIVRTTTDSGGTCSVVFELWRQSAITVPVPSPVLQQALGLTHRQLLGAEATALICVDAVLETEVRPVAWQPISRSSATPVRAA